MSQKITKQNKRPKKQNRPFLPVWMAAGGVVLILVAFLAVKGGSGGGPKVPVTTKGAPGINVDKEKVDLGDVKLGKTVDVTFQITNVGDQPLRLTKPPYVEVVEGC